MSCVDDVVCRVATLADADVIASFNVAMAQVRFLRVRAGVLCTCDVRRDGFCTYAVYADVVSAITCMKAHRTKALLCWGGDRKRRGGTSIQPQRRLGAVLCLRTRPWAGTTWPSSEKLSWRA